MLESGEINIGEMVCPKIAKSLKLVNGKVTEVLSMVSGRKIPLEDIRKKTLQQQQRFMRLRTDESWASMDISSLTRLYFKYTSSKEQAC